jgi:O-succinylbenzoate synthase
MRTLIDFDAAPLFGLPVTNGSATVFEGALLEGPQGWGEFSPPLDCPADELGRWLTAATEPGTVGWPDAVRGRIPVAVAVPAVHPVRARQIAAESGCHSADVTVGAGALADDVARLEAVRDGLGADGVIRLSVGGAWDVDAAVSAIEVLTEAAGGVGYVEQPCRTAEEMAAVRRRVDVRIAGCASCLLDDAASVAPGDAADVAVLVSARLGGVRRALRQAERLGLPCVVSSEVQTSVGLAAGLALAGALAELPFACGLGTATGLCGDVVSRGRALVAVDGHLPVAPMPPAPDPDALARYALTDPARVAWWRERLRAAQEYQ